MDIRYYTLKGIGVYASGALIGKVSLYAGTSLGVLALGTTLCGFTIGFVGAFIIGAVAALLIGLIGSFIVYHLGKFLDANYKKFKELIFE